MKRFNGRSRIIGILVVAAALATGAYAFTATNTVPDSKAGSGSGTISGYAVSNVAYTLNATTPSDIASMSFTLDAPATTVKAKIVSSSTTYTNCGVVGVTVTCTFSPNIAVTAANELSVIATS